MNKDEFLNALLTALKGLPQEEINEAICYYEEYLSDAEEGNLEEALSALDKPAAIAAQIRAEFALKELRKQPANAKKGISAAWLVLLAILATPIALPLALAAICVFFALFITVAAFLFSFAITAVALVVAGIAVGAVSATILFVNVGTGIMGLGASFICIGVGILFAILTVLFARWGFRGLAFLLNRIGKKKGEA